MMCPKPRTGIVLLLAALLAACGGVDPLRRIQGALDAELGRPDDAQEAAAPAGVGAVLLPFSQAAVRIDAGAAGRMVLARMEGDVQQWMATDGRMIWMRNGRIVATRGFRADLLRSEFVLPPVEPTQFEAWPAPQETATWVEASTGDAADGVVLSLRLERAVRSTVQTERGMVELQQVIEHVRAPGGERWDNEYWIDVATGRVEIARQRVPGTPHDVRFERIYPVLPNAE